MQGHQIHIGLVSGDHEGSGLMLVQQYLYLPDAGKYATTQGRSTMPYKKSTIQDWLRPYPWET